MNVVSLFSGIGGFDLGLERTGFRVVAQVENDAFCRRVLAARWPGVEREDDVRTLGWCDVSGGECDGPVDLLIGGFPCQDLSVAGKRAGLAGSRSSLFYEYVRIAKTLAPTYGLVENVPGLLSSQRGVDFGLVLQGLRECWPAVGYRILDSQYFGVAQRRRRVFLVGGPTASSVGEILALTEGGGGDSATGGQAWARVAASLTGGSHRLGVNDPDRRKEDGTPLYYSHDYNQDRIYGPDGPAPAHTAQDSNRARNVMTGQTVRRLTPLECERLQGFPDGWTCLCQSLEVYAADPDAAALACRCPDSPRYRALGNAVTVPVIEWLGHRLRHHCEGTL